MALAKFNRTTNVFTVNTEHYSDYKKLSDLTPETEYSILGFYLNKDSKFGEHYVIISDGYYVNVPASMNDTFKAMLEDADTIALINQGNEKFVVRDVFSKKWNKDIRVVDFI